MPRLVPARERWRDSVASHLSGGSGPLGWLGRLLPLAVAGLLLVVTAAGATIPAATKLETLAIEGLVALGVVLLGLRRPVIVFCVVLAILPMQVVLLSLLYREGVPGAAVRAMGSGKELLTIIAVVTALRGVNRRIPTDMIDRLGLLFVGVTTIYLVVPFAVPGSLGGQSLQVRSLSWRIEALFVVFMLAARRIPFTSRERQWIVRTILGIGALLAVVAGYEWLEPATFNSWLVRTARVPIYDTQILHSPPPNPTNLLTIANVDQGHPRTGSLLLSSINYCWYAFAALALALQRLCHGRFSALSVVIASLSALGILLTGTRSAVIGALVLTAFTLRLSSVGQSRGRSRLAVLVLVGAIALSPVFARSGVAQRVTAAISGTDASASQHKHSLFVGYADLLHAPAGRGLGSNPSIGARFQTSIVVDPENTYLQIGIELGIVGLLLYVLLLVNLIRTARQVALKKDPGHELAAASYALLLGLAVGGLLLHTWLNFATSMTVWGLAGIAIPVHERARPL